MSDRPSAPGRDRLRELLDAVVDTANAIPSRRRRVLMVAHDVADTEYLILQSEALTEAQWQERLSPKSFQLHGIVAHVLTYSAHRRELVRAMLSRHGLVVGRGDPLDWMRGN